MQKQVVYTATSYSIYSGLTASSPNNACTDVDSDTYAQYYFTSPSRPNYGTGFVRLFFSTENDPIPENAVIESVTSQIKIQATGLNTSNKVILFSTNTTTADPIGTASPTSTVQTLDFTINSAKYDTVRGETKFTMHYQFAWSNPYGNGNLYIYGANVKVTYTVHSNVYVKDTEWKEVDDAYEKVNGVWVQKEAKTVFTSDKHYEKGNV